MQLEGKLYIIEVTIQTYTDFEDIIIIRRIRIIIQ